MLIFGHLATHAILPATQTLNYDVIADFEPVALIADTPQGIAGKPRLAGQGLEGADRVAEGQPGKRTMGSVGVAGPSDLSAILFQQQTGTSFQLVPYRGGAPLLQDLVGGQIDMGLFQVSAFLEQLRGGQIKAYAVMSRSGGWRPRPTFRRSTRPACRGFVATIWHGHLGAQGHPKDIVAKLNAAVCRRWPIRP